MKNFYLFLLVSIVAFMLPGKGAAQCTTPTSITYTTVQAACFGNGTVTVTTVNGATAPDDSTVLYQLIYDSANSPNNLLVVKDWQTSPVFTQVARGLYFINVQQICTNGSSGVYRSGAVTVSGTINPVSITAVTKVQDAVCNNGSFNVTATGGSGTYQYALVPTQNAPEPVANYVRPKQASNTFTGLAAGTYYVRAYDTCDSYATAPIAINTVTDSVTMGSSFAGTYSCDSIMLTHTITNYNRFATGAPDPAERIWYKIGVNGTADTLTGWSYYFAGIANSSINKSFYFTGYPDTVYWGYQSACGKIYTDSIIINKPVTCRIDRRPCSAAVKR